MLTLIFFFFFADSNKQSLAGFAVQSSAPFFLLHSLLHKFWVQIICLTFSAPLYAPQIKMWQKSNYLIKGKLHFLSLSYTLYFNLILNFSIMLIWYLTFQYRVNLVTAIIFWMKIDDVLNG